MDLRQTRERRPPRLYQGDGTYIEPTTNSSSTPQPHPHRRPLTHHAPRSSDATIDLSSPSARSASHIFPTPEETTSRASNVLPRLPPATPPLTQSVPAGGLKKRTLPMANIKRVRPHGEPSPPPPAERKRKRARFVEEAEPGAGAQHPKKPAKQAAALPSHMSGSPAAFPSLSPGEIFKYEQNEKHGTMRLLQERCSNNDGLCKASINRINAMYDCKRFPAAMSAEEKQWYKDLKQRLAIGDCGDDMVSFRSLWPSLRQTIIEEICEEVKGLYHSYYEPVRYLLSLGSPGDQKLQAILEENRAPWNDMDDIPAFLLELKRANPDQPVDPDTPPPDATLKAVRYLKQRHLPASLLGEWQFTLPSLPMTPIVSLPSGRVTPISSVEEDSAAKKPTIRAAGGGPRSDPVTPLPSKESQALSASPKSDRNSQAQSPSQASQLYQQYQRVRSTSAHAGDLSGGQKRDSPPQNHASTVKNPTGETGEGSLRKSILKRKASDGNVQLRGGKERQSHSDDDAAEADALETNVDMRGQRPVRTPTQLQQHRLLLNDRMKRYRMSAPAQQFSVAAQALLAARRPSEYSSQSPHRYSPHAQMFATSFGKDLALQRLQHDPQSPQSPHRRLNQMSPLQADMMMQRARDQQSSTARASPRQEHIVMQESSRPPKLQSPFEEKTALPVLPQKLEQNRQHYLSRNRHIQHTLEARAAQSGSSIPGPHQATFTESEQTQLDTLQYGRSQQEWLQLQNEAYAQIAGLNAPVSPLSISQQFSPNSRHRQQISQGSVVSRNGVAYANVMPQRTPPFTASSLTLPRMNGHSSPNLHAHPQGRQDRAGNQPNRHVPTNVSPRSASNTAHGHRQAPPDSPRSSSFREFIPRSPRPSNIDQPYFLPNSPPFFSPLLPHQDVRNGYSSASSPPGQPSHPTGGRRGVNPALMDPALIAQDRADRCAANRDAQNRARAAMSGARVRTGTPSVGNDGRVTVNSLDEINAVMRDLENGKQGGG